MFEINAKSPEAASSGGRKPARKNAQRVKTAHQSRTGSARFDIPGTDKVITLPWSVVNDFEALFFHCPADAAPEAFGNFEPAFYIQTPAMAYLRDFSVDTDEKKIVIAETGERHGFQIHAIQRIDPARVIELKIPAKRTVDAIKAMLRYCYMATGATTDYDWTLHPIVEVQSKAPVYYDGMQPGPGWICVRRVNGVNLDFATVERNIPFREGMRPWTVIEPHECLPQITVLDHEGDEQEDLREQVMEDNAPPQYHKSAEVVLERPGDKKTVPLILSREVLRPRTVWFKGRRLTHDVTVAVRNIPVGARAEIRVENKKQIYNAIQKVRADTTLSARERARIKFKIEADPYDRYFFLVAREA